MTVDEVKVIVEQFAKDYAHNNQSPELLSTDWPSGYTDERKQALIDNNFKGIAHVIKIIEYNYKLTKK